MPKQSSTSLTNYTIEGGRYSGSHIKTSAPADFEVVSKKVGVKKWSQPKGLAPSITGVNHLLLLDLTSSGQQRPSTPSS
ncbi:MAG: hypothetical protein ABW072_07375 [Sedimenticola sp.]